jgi:hypothetical protein
VLFIRAGTSSRHARAWSPRGALLTLGIMHGSVLQMRAQWPTQVCELSRRGGVRRPGQCAVTIWTLDGMGCRTPGVKSLRADMWTYRTALKR